MKNGNNQLRAVLFVVALALAPIIQAAPSPDGGPTHPAANEAPRPDGGPDRDVRPSRARPAPALRPGDGAVTLAANEAPRPDGGPDRDLRTPRARPIAAPRPDGGPANLAANESASANSEASYAYEAIPEGENLPIVTVHSTDSVTRGKTGSFVLNTNPVVFGGIYVTFTLSGSAVAGVDYVQPLSPAHIGQSGYGTILIQTLADPRGGSSRQAYSVVAKLDAGLGYALGIPSSATMWIKP